MKKIALKDKTIFFEKKVSALSIKLRVNSKKEIFLTAPLFCAERTAVSFLKQHWDWLERQLNHIPDACYFVPEMKIDIFGEKVLLQKAPACRRQTFLENNVLYVSGDISFFHRRVKDYLKKKALLYFEEEAIKKAAILGEKIAKVTIKDTSSRWGSCSSRKNLNFCWRLILAPSYVAEYIVAHEVAHLREMNHSIAFWKVVDLLTENRRIAERWLKKNSADLQKWG